MTYKNISLVVTIIGVLVGIASYLHAVNNSNKSTEVSDIYGDDAKVYVAGNNIIINDDITKNNKEPKDQKKPNGFIENPYNINKEDFIDIKNYQLKLVKLRYGFQYTFHLDYKNSSAYEIGINKVKVTFSEKHGDFNDGDNPDFSETDEILEKKYMIQPNEEIKVVKSNKLYPIKFRPDKRTNDSLFIVYKTYFYSKENDIWNKKPNLDIHIQPYQITWCGDGIIDNYLDPTGKMIIEECDPKDSSMKNWGVNGCMDLFCKAVD